MKDSTLSRCKTWVHWVLLESPTKDIFYEDRLALAKDLKKLIEVAEESEIHLEKCYEEGHESREKGCKLSRLLEELDKEWNEICNRKS